MKHINWWLIDNLVDYWKSWLCLLKTYNESNRTLNIFWSVLIPTPGWCQDNFKLSIWLHRKQLLVLSTMIQAKSTFYLQCCFSGLHNAVFTRKLLLEVYFSVWTSKHDLSLRRDKSASGLSLQQFCEFTFKYILLTYDKTSPRWTFQCEKMVEHYLYFRL